MSDNNQDRSQDEGQSGIDRETEQRNRENETGQAGNQQFAPGQDGGKSPGGQDKDSTAFGQQGQSAGGDTSLADRAGQTGGQSSTGQAPSGDSGFVGTGSDAASDNLTKSEQDFAAEGQGAQDSDAGTADIETGQAQDNDPSLDGGSDSNR